MSEPGLRQVKQAIAAHRRFLVTGHIDPDPDALGSVLAMVRVLEQVGKEAVATSPDPVPAGYRFLPGSERIVLPDDLSDPFDALVVLDGPLDRIGSVRPWCERVKTIINIDHHETNPRQAPVHWVDPSAAVLGEMIYRLARELKVDVDAAMATNLYTALLTDTGSFRFSNTTARTLSIAADFVAQGADPAAIAERVFGERPWSVMQLLIRALNTLERTADGRIAWMTISQQMIADAGAGPDDTDGFIQFPRTIAGVDIALLFRELPTGHTKISWRSRDPIDVSRLAESLGGGGHPRAAGCLLKRPLAEAQRIVLSKTAAYLTQTDEGSYGGEPY